MQINKHFEILLKKIRFYPLNEKNWDVFKIIHYKNKPKNYKKDLKKMKDTFDNKAGIYCYMDRNKSILYVGECKNIFERVKTHYRTAFKPMSSDRTKRWFKFFSKRTGPLKIFWKEIEEKDRFQRVAIEHMLKYVLKPKFDYDKK